MKFYQCINESKVCNNEYDCGNWKDEFVEKCEEGFRCKNGLNIPTSFKCDLFDDCSDNSDEDSCDYVACPQQTCDCYKEGSDTCGDGRRCFDDFRELG